MNILFEPNLISLKFKEKKKKEIHNKYTLNSALQNQV